MRKFFATNAYPLNKVRQGGVLQHRFNNTFQRQVKVENNPTWILVVALALFAPDGRLLLQQRLAGKHHGGLWEFPGGKVERGETPRVALAREVDEELGIKLDPSTLVPAHFAEESGERTVVLNLYTASLDACDPHGRDGQLWGWFDAEQAAALALAPMDRKLLSHIRHFRVAKL
ncbi:MAG: NUDIX domain-containing protein [Alteraurantiacibacter sp.]